MKNVPLPAEGIDVYYPPAFTALTDDVVTVEGSVADPELYDLEITVNGESVYRVYVSDFLFAEDVYLDPGVNTITVGDKVLKVFLAGEGGAFLFDGEPEEACLWCHGDLVRGGRRGNSPPFTAPSKRADA